MEDTPQNYVVKCPITSKPIQVKVKNSKCGHEYEKSAILQYIKNKEGRAKKY